MSDDLFDSTTPIASRLGARTNHRLRSSTLSQGAQKVDASLVFKTLRHHVRTNHAFAPLSSTAQPSEPPVPLLKSETTEPLSEESSSSIDLVEEASQSEPLQESDELKALFDSLKAARAAEKIPEVKEIIQTLRSTGKLDVSGYNVIYETLNGIRQPGESLAALLEVYNEMLARNLLPSVRTYAALIMAFTSRDADVYSTSKKIERRIIQRRAMGLQGSPEDKLDQEKLAQLTSENNMEAAFKLFQTAISRTRSKWPLQWTVYNPLLRTCANHGQVDKALQIFAHFERRTDVQLSAQPFAHLINTYARVGDIQGAEQAFEEFKQASKAGKLVFSTRTDGRERSGQVAQIGVWNCMIEAYFVCGQGDKGLGLLEQMLDSKAGLQFGPSDIPVPSPTTFSSIIVGFCRAGDLDSALTWFNKLMDVGKTTKDTIAPCLTLPQPTYYCTRMLIMYLVMQGNRINDVNDVWIKAVEADPQSIVNDIKRIVLMANLQYLESTPDIPKERAFELLEFTLQRVLSRRLLPKWTSGEVNGTAGLVQKYVDLYNRYGGPDGVLSFAKQAAFGAWRYEENDTETAQLGNLLIDAVRSVHTSVWTLEQELALAYIAHSCELPVDNESLLSAFLRAKESEETLPPIQPIESTFILGAALEAAKNENGTYSHSPVVEAVMEYITDKTFQLSLAPKALRLTLNEYMKAVDASRAASPTLTETQSVQSSQGTAVETPHNIVIDSVHSAYVDEYRRPNSKISPVVGYDRVKVGLQLNVYPNCQVLGRLINFLGRVGEVDKLKEMYILAQTVLNSMANKKHQSVAWFHIEDSMIIALAHAGDIDAAHIHRTRILEVGGSPSPDAYGALVQHVTSTTDDAANAMALFQEAMARNVTPNLYLYNTIISKLAKARKADYAIQLFQELKLRGIQPSSVTYGSVIAACCRVGDAQSAENLFSEMASQPSFKPRVPPYNTMMQFYTHTKPDRERVLFYHDALINASVEPTAHTYKVRPFSLRFISSVVLTFSFSPASLRRLWHYRPLRL